MILLTTTENTLTDWPMSCNYDIFSISPLLARLFDVFFYIAGHVLDLAPKRLTISSSHRRGSIFSCRFCFLEYHSTAAQVYLLSANVSGPAERLLSFVHCRITSHRMCSCNDIPRRNISIALWIVTRFSSFMDGVNVSLVYNISGQTVLLKNGSIEKIVRISPYIFVYKLILCIWRRLIYYHEIISLKNSLSTIFSFCLTFKLTKLCRRKFLP